ncbi:MAG: alpha/beta-type small acid-soluble spore protein [Clostridia bacterium]|nr:alpha/beta-type small acid-soluble spore protein [Clostridia bacterium]
MNNNNQQQAPINTNNNSNNSNQQGSMVPEARQALDNMKYEIAGELGINLKHGYNGDLPSRQAGYIGGYMVNLMQPAERLCAYYQLPPIRFSRNGLRNQFEQKVEYQVKVGIEV